MAFVRLIVPGGEALLERMIEAITLAKTSDARIEALRDMINLQLAEFNRHLVECSDRYRSLQALVLRVSGAIITLLLAILSLFIKAHFQL